MRIFLVALTSFILAGPVSAIAFERVVQREGFLSLIKDRDLTRLGIRLTVTQDGKIKGRAFGWKITGDWTWDGGYFCRDLYLDDSELDMANCQLVQVKGNTLRFTSDKGSGDYADLRLK